jgi:4-amino-4-deoxychorismate lyase
MNSAPALPVTTATMLVNGVESAMVDARDRGLHYGDGLFETIACRAGRPRWLEAHLQRLTLGAERLGLQLPDAALLRAELAQLAAGQQRCLLKLIVTRGLATARGYAPTGDEQPTRILSRHAWPEAAPAPFRVAYSRVPLAENPLLAGIKHLNRLEQVLAQRELAGSALQELLMCTAAGAVVCGSMSNLFLCEEAGLATADLQACGVAGVTRARVLRAAEALGIRVRIGTLTVAEVAAAGGAFLCNVRLGLQPVDWLAGRSVQRDLRLTALERWVDDDRH